jgi:hypothetical protein
MEVFPQAQNFCSLPKKLQSRKNIYRKYQPSDLIQQQQQIIQQPIVYEVPIEQLIEQPIENEVSIKIIPEPVIINEEKEKEEDILSEPIIQQPKLNELPSKEDENNYRKVKLNNLVEHYNELAGWYNSKKI